MKIEILFPEFCNLYGDLANMDYLRRCLPQAEFVETSLQEEPLLAREKVDMVYLGPMTERLQEAVLEKLRPLRARIWELIDQDTLFLCTGNSWSSLASTSSRRTAAAWNACPSSPCTPSGT